MNRSDGADAPYWAELTRGRLTLPRCDGCARWVWPAALRCGACGAEGVHWEERVMAGTVFAWTRTWHRFAMTETLDLPFTTVLVEIDDCGVRLLGRLEDPDQIDPSIGEVLTGTPSFTTVGDDDIPTILWRRAS